MSGRDRDIVTYDRGGSDLVTLTSVLQLTKYLVFTMRAAASEMLRSGVGEKEDTSLKICILNALILHG